MSTSLPCNLRLKSFMYFVVSTKKPNFQTHLQSVSKGYGRFFLIKNISISFLSLKNCDITFPRLSHYLTAIKYSISGNSVSISFKMSRNRQCLSSLERIQFTVDITGSVVHDKCKVFPHNAC